MAAAEPVTKPFIPPFLAKLGIKPGEWMYASKPGIRAFLRPSWPLKARIWACLVLQSFGYETDLATVMKRGDYAGAKPKTEPLKPGGIATMLNKATAEYCRDTGAMFEDDTKVTRQDMRRALADMEDEGLIMRVRANCPPSMLKGLTLNEVLEKRMVASLEELSETQRKKVSNSVCIYLHARPRPQKHSVGKNAYRNDAKSNDSKEPRQEVFWFMKDNEFSALYAKASEKAPEKAAAIMAKLERQVEELKRQGIQQLAEIAELQVSAPQIKPDPVTKGDSPQTGTPPETTPDRRGAENLSEPEIYQILVTMRKYAPCDDDVARELLRDCRAAMPSCTAVQICMEIDQKGPAVKGKKGIDFPSKYLKRAVLKQFQGHAGQLNTGMVESPIPDELAEQEANLNWARIVLENQADFPKEHLDEARNILRKAAASEQPEQQRRAHGD